MLDRGCGRCGADDDDDGGDDDDEECFYESH